MILLLCSFDDETNSGAAITQNLTIDKPDFPNYPAQGDRFLWWAIGDNPLWLNFSNPTILNLQNTTWDPNYVVVYPNNNKSADSWVYMVVTAPSKPPSGSPKAETFWPVAHPVCALSLIYSIRCYKNHC